MKEFLNHLNTKLIALFENDCDSANKLYNNFISTIAKVVDLFTSKGNATQKRKKAKG